ncbi:MAG: zf-TFIIB domain-containing protein [Myxococcota bacterium]|jgi:Zn-finger nucleic acid-binding protein|nr:zf-TFIIB domain-containing protein [Myxococcota bacterium]
MPRQCPDCGAELQLKRNKGGADSPPVEVDVCPGCEGIYLDPGEFDALVAPKLRGGAMETFLAGIAVPPSECRFCAELQQGSLCALCGRPLARACPDDAEAMLELHFEELSAARCPKCSGIWLGGAARRRVAKAIIARSGVHQAVSSPASPLQPAIPAANEQTPLGLRVAAAQAAQKPVELELAIPSPRELERPDPTELVYCIHCSQQIQRAYTVTIEGTIYCEACVAQGKAPGEYSRRSINEMRAQMIATYARERANLDFRKAEMADGRLMKPRPGHYEANALRALFRLIRSVF